MSSFCWEPVSHPWVKEGTTKRHHGRWQQHQPRSAPSSQKHLLSCWQHVCADATPKLLTPEKPCVLNWQRIYEKTNLCGTPTTIHVASRDRRVARLCHWERNEENRGRGFVCASFLSRLCTPDLLSLAGGRATSDTHTLTNCDLAACLARQHARKRSCVEATCWREEARSPSNTRQEP